MERLRDLMRAGNPLSLVAVVVGTVVILQILVAILVGASARNDASAAAEQIARVIGDSTALHVLTTTRPTENAVEAADRLLTQRRVSFDDKAEMADTLATVVRNYPQVSGLALAQANGDAVQVERNPANIVATIFERGAPTDRYVFDSNGAPLTTAARTPPAPPLSESGWFPWALDQDGLAWGEPSVVGVNSRVVVYTTITHRSLEGPDSVAMARTDATLFAHIVSESTGENLGDAFLVSGSGDVLAAPAKYATAIAAIQAQQERPATLTDLGVNVGQGSHGRTGTAASSSGTVYGLGSAVVYERAVYDGGAPDWKMYVVVDASQAVPAIAGFQRTVLLYVLGIGASVVAALGILWLLRGPLGEVATRARTDAITGLANRHEFESRGRDAARAAARRGAKLLVVVLDLDHFKRVNDTLGHPAGDAALREFGLGLAEAVGPRDVLARLGGDEFGAVHWLIDKEVPEQWTENLRAAGEARLKAVVPKDLGVGASAGFAVADGRSSLDAVLRWADSALVEGRRSGKGRTFSASR